MKRDQLFDALGGVKDEYILSAADLLGYTKEEPMHKTIRFKTISRGLLIAAVITAFLAVTALASLFAFSTRVPDADETFRIHWPYSEGGYLEWKDAKLVVTFPETAESHPVEFKPGWLPFALPETLPLSDPWSGLTGDTWFKRFTSESLSWSETAGVPAAYKDLTQPLEVQAYAMSQFNQGGAMLMLYQTPGELTEEHWDEPDVDVLRFHGEQHFDARPEFNMPPRTIEYNYVLLSNAREGWIIELDGQLDMDTIVKVAKNLQIRQTGEVLTYDDFESHYLFFDGGVG